MRLLTLSTSTAVKDAPKEAEADAEADLRSRTVVSPPGNEKLHCPICQEELEEFWCDEEEEWMLRNAVRVNDKIYHATCHADTVKVGRVL
jgi:pre-mRNA cleavage complex 2 protein Pcf11